MILRVSPNEPCSEDKKLNKKKESSEIIRTFFLLVELEGIEPSSKRGNHKLSTCLSLPNFRATAEPKPSTIALSFKVSFLPQGRQELSPM